MKRYLIIILVLIIIGLYFAPEITRSMLKATGMAAANVADVLKKEVVKTDIAKKIENKVIDTVKEAINDS